MNIGNAIKTIRLKKCLSQKELAEKLGITQGFLSLIERNDREPGGDLITRMAEALCIPAQLIYLLAFEDKPKYKQYNKEMNKIADATTEIFQAITK